MKLSNKRTLTEKRKGFTLVELLVVIAIIAVLAGLSYSPILKVLNNANVVKSQKVCRELVASIDSFQLDYGFLPFESGSSPTQDQQVTTDDADFLEVIMGIETDINTRAIAYFDTDQADGDTNGLVVDAGGAPESLLDKWGNHYHILLDYDLDGTIDISSLLSDPGAGPDADIYSEIRRTSSAVALSPGKDEEFNDIGDSTSF